MLAAGALITALIITGRSQQLAPDRQAARPAACYPTTAQAAAAGYPPAPPPAGTLEVGGVYLTPPGTPFRRRCQQAADGVGFAVPCPALLPAMSPHAVPPNPCEQRFPNQRGGAFLLDQDGFVVPPGYVGAAGQAQGRLVVGAARRADDPLVACEGRQRLVGTVAPHGVAGQLLECAGGGLHRDSVLVRWRERGAVMAVSVLGQARLQERLALTVAEHTRVLPPSPRNGDDR